MNDTITVSKAALREVLGSPIAYYVTFARVTGDVGAGLLASQFFYWYGKGRNDDGWIYKTQTEIEEETGLSRYNQETARKYLKKLGVLEEKRIGLPARLHYRLDINLLLKIVDDWLNGESNNQVGGNPTNWPDASPQSGEGESANHSIYTKTTPKITTESADALPPTPQPQQAMFGKVCELLGWDYKTLDKSTKGQIAQTIGIFTTAGYNIQDLDDWWEKVWKFDWRWLNKHSRPTLNQLKQELGKVRTADALPLPQTNVYTNGYTSKTERTHAAIDRVFAMMEEQGIVYGQQ